MIFSFIQITCFSIKIILKKYYANSKKLDYTFELSISSNIIKTIQNWPEFRKIKNVQAFLKFANFHCCFIYNYSDIAILLIQLM